MPKEKNAHRKNDASKSDEAVLNLTIDGSFPDAEVREVNPVPKDAFQTPCSISGVMAGLSGGSLGYLFGFGTSSFLSFFTCTNSPYKPTINSWVLVSE